MPKFRVSICRTSYRHATIEVDAENIQKAKEKALDKAVDIDFPCETNSEYEVTGVVFNAPYRERDCYTVR